MARYHTLFTACLLGCVGDVSPPITESEVVDPAGVSIVTSTVPLWAPDSGWQVDSLPTTVIGADESDPNQQWEWVEAAARFSNGNVVLATMGTLRLFSPDGKFIRLLSRAGDGPGEFRFVDGLLVLPGDVLRVNDFMGYRIATYSPDGTLVRDDRLDVARWQALGRWAECKSGLLPDGSRFGCQPDPTIPLSATNRPSIVDAKGSSSPGPGLLNQLRRVYVATPDLTSTHSLGILAGGESFGVSLGMGEVFVTHPFHARSFIAAGGTPMRIAITNGADYRIELWAPDGSLERIIKRPGSRRAPTVKERAEAAISMEPYVQGMDAVTRETVLAAVPTPDSLPAVTGLAMTAEGEVVVQREGTLPSQTTATWDVFNTSGQWLGSFRLPCSCSLLSVGTDHVLVRRYVESSGERWIEVYRLRR